MSYGQSASSRGPLVPTDLVAVEVRQLGAVAGELEGQHVPGPALRHERAQRRRGCGCRVAASSSSSGDLEPQRLERPRPSRARRRRSRPGAWSGSGRCPTQSAPPAPAPCRRRVAVVAAAGAAAAAAGAPGWPSSETRQDAARADHGRPEPCGSMPRSIASSGKVTGGERAEDAMGDAVHRGRGRCRSRHGCARCWRSARRRLRHRPHHLGVRRRPAAQAEQVGAGRRRPARETSRPRIGVFRLGLERMVDQVEERLPVHVGDVVVLLPVPLHREHGERL